MEAISHGCGDCGVPAIKKLYIYKSGLWIRQILSEGVAWVLLLVEEYGLDLQVLSAGFLCNWCDYSISVVGLLTEIRIGLKLAYVFFLIKQRYVGVVTSADGYLRIGASFLLSFSCITRCKCSGDLCTWMWGKVWAFKRIQFIPTTRHTLNQQHPVT